ncbi:hypothetical protein [Francisella persica]|uniref:hypothetical protein n=1 Tax=Francisella persica TaxID=954 RepID=UPI000A5F8C17|nr:hypothetical protein [Francisella persica]
MTYFLIVKKTYKNARYVIAKFSNIGSYKDRTLKQVLIFDNSFNRKYVLSIND